MTRIEGRKADHINICLEQKVSTDYRYWDDLVKDALSFMGRYEDEVPLARRLCLAFLAYLEDQARGDPETLR